jgi:DNA (cytosine-5)-methyltransferase 1
MSMTALTFVDLFSGAGLFSAGFAQAGFTPLLAVELDPNAVASYRRNIAPVAVHSSVSGYSKIPRADVVIAGPPCQGFSTLGRQDPLDVRNNLSLDIARWAKRTDAQVVVVENVPPFLVSPQWRALKRKFENEGFGVFTWILDAVDFGAPQFRRRAFTIASKVGEFAAPKASRRRTNAGQILSRSVPVGDPMHRWPTPKGIAAERIPLIPALGDKRDLMKTAPHLCPPSWERVGCHATDVWGRLDPGQPANTIRCCFQNPSKGRYLHPTEDRVLSLREGARLQGVPDHWQFSGLPYPIARQIGNGVPVPLGLAVAGAVREALTSERREFQRAA